MFTSFSPVFLEEPIDDKQRAYENIQHKMFDNTEATIQLNVKDVRLVLDKAKQHYLEQWRAKRAHFLMSSLTLLVSAFLLFKEIKNKNN